MTVIPPPGTPHLDDEAISAVLDGEGTVEESLHADGCDRCGTRLGDLRAASLLVRTPVVPLDPDRRADVIAAALAGAAGAELTDADADGNVVPLRRRRVTPQWLVAAAAVIVAVAAVAVLPRGSDDRDTGTSVAIDEDAFSESAPSVSEDMEAFAGAAGPYDAGDVGSIDEGSLRATIEDGLAAARTGPGAAGSGQGDPGTGGSGQGDPGGSTGSDGGLSSGAMAPAPIPCEAELRGSAPLGAVIYHATGTYDGEDVQVLVFDVDPDLWAYVVTTDGCAIRLQQTFSR